MKAVNTIVGLVLGKATVFELFICQHRGCDFDHDIETKLSNHVYFAYGHGIPLPRTKQPVERTKVVRMVEGEWKYEGPVEEPVQRCWEQRSLKTTPSHDTNHWCHSVLVVLPEVVGVMPGVMVSSEEVSETPQALLLP